MLDGHMESERGLTKGPLQRRDVVWPVVTASLQLLCGELPGVAVDGEHGDELESW